jgi:hypothetical protein
MTIAELQAETKARAARLMAAVERQRDRNTAKMIAEWNWPALGSIGMPEYEGPKHETMMFRVQRAVAARFNISIADLHSRSQTRSVTVPRFVAMFLARQIIPSISFTRIGEEFRRDHSTVVHAVGAVHRRIELDHDFADKVISLGREIVRGAFILKEKTTDHWEDARADIAELTEKIVEIIGDEKVSHRSICQRVNRDRQDHRVKHVLRKLLRDGRIEQKLESFPGHQAYIYQAAKT